MKLDLRNPDLDCNLHTHTRYCDGKDTPQELIDRAIELGFRTLGFSGHGTCDFDRDCCMSPEGEALYVAEIRALAEAYKGKIDILLGMERDYYNTNHFHEFDYEIGSVHYVRAGDFYISVDDTPERLEKGVRKAFGGDFRKFVEQYYQLEGEVLDVTGADLVGHFDLITKLNAGGRFFDESADWYRRAALHAVRKIASKEREVRPAVRKLLGNPGSSKGKPAFEINTGGMAKGYLSRPYPDRFLLEEIARLGCPVILSSDCHDRGKLDFAFRKVREDVFSVKTEWEN